MWHWHIVSSQNSVDSCETLAYNGRKRKVTKKVKEEKPPNYGFRDQQAKI